MNVCSECGGIGGCKVGCAGPQLPRQLARACSELGETENRYLKQGNQDNDDWARGMAMGIGLSLDFLHQWTHGQYGTPLEPRKEAS